MGESASVDLIVGRCCTFSKRFYPGRDSSRYLSQASSSHYHELLLNRLKRKRLPDGSLFIQEINLISDIVFFGDGNRRDDFVVTQIVTFEIDEEDTEDKV